MNSTSVRQAVLADLEELAALFDQYRQFQGRASDVAAARSFLRERFNHGESVVFICHDGDAPVGFAQLYPSFSSVSLSRVFVVNDLFVHASGRRKGVASMLLAAIESYAWSFGSARVTLNVARGNESAQRLYEARGWKQDDQFFMYHRYPDAP
ncbi:GNAT family N-acetyltransferase [Variovorax sp. KBW07]|uniref:GNAT family N-acetyltransferase n=1 Tax=Variovorax sp. KBW07 TaxID=2153358 RepID=UPI000F58A000|nr:GNAT family N-acetyltransferase [Variovorax sp. KBW07]RQO47570.1 GNAT family N-acetyltransferase [Variovorax sp. KBW07]